MNADAAITALETPITVAQRQCFKPWLTWATTGDQLIVSHGASVTVFEGAASVQLLPSMIALLDGTLTIDEIVEVLGRDLRPAIEQAVDELSTRGLLLPIDDDRPGISSPSRHSAAVAIAADQPAGDPDDVTRKLAAASITIAGFAPLAGEIIRLLRLFGVGDVSLGDRERRLSTDRLSVAVSGPGEDRFITEWNEQALATGALWLPVLPYDGRLATIGPLIVPGSTACFECLRIRRASNLGFRVEQRALDRARSHGPGRGGVAGGPIAYITAALAADAIVSALLAGEAEPSMLVGRVLTVAPSIDGPDVQMHRLYRVPRCTACSRALGLGYPQPWFDPDPDLAPQPADLTDRTQGSEHVCPSCAH